MVAFSGVFLSSCSELIPGLGMDASWRKKPLPPARLSMGQCLRFDPVLPAPTSILFARPLRPEVETNVGGGGGRGRGCRKRKCLLPFTSSGDHHTPLYEAC